MATRPGASDGIFELEVTLRESEPRIWRRVAVPADIRLSKLHLVVQCAMGWTDSHLHRFVTDDGNRYESKDPELDPDSAARDEARARLNSLLGTPGERLSYDYDYGDGWEHDIVLVRVCAPDPALAYPLCLAGERACPPEDCGWLTGYYSILEIVANPQHEEHEEMQEWLGEGFDPAAFDRDEVNELLASVLSDRRSRTLRIVK
jgi:hypothetical protein